MARDVLAIVEAAYRGDVDLDTWMTGLVDAATPALDFGLGVYAHPFAIQDDGTVRGDGNICGAGGPIPELRRTLDEIALVSKDSQLGAVVKRLYPRAPIAGTGAEIAGIREGLGAFELAQRFLPAARDAIGIVGGDPSGRGVVLHANTTARARLSAGERRLWLRVAVHLASGYRLFRRRHAEVDAVLAPDGRVLHAEPGAQSPERLASLRDEARAIDRARGRMRRASPEEALAMWRGLVDGTWSLVDQIDSDGRRYVFAKRNAPEVRRWHELSDRERQVLAYAAEGQPHKVIAYELGIAVPTVSTHLRSAARKLGVRTRPELVHAFKRASGEAR